MCHTSSETLHSPFQKRLSIHSEENKRTPTWTEPGLHLEHLQPSPQFSIFSLKWHATNLVALNPVVQTQRTPGSPLIGESHNLHLPSMVSWTKSQAPSSATATSSPKASASGPKPPPSVAPVSARVAATANLVAAHQRPVIPTPSGIQRGTPREGVDASLRVLARRVEPPASRVSLAPSSARNQSLRAVERGRRTLAAPPPSVR